MLTAFWEKATPFQQALLLQGESEQPSCLQLVEGDSNGAKVSRAAATACAALYLAPSGLGLFCLVQLKTPLDLAT